MGPPDKREPKMSNSTFQHTPSNMDSPSTINKAIIRPSIIDLTQKGKHVPKENKNSTPTTLNTDFLHVAITNQIRSNSASSEGGISPVIFRKVIAQIYKTKYHGKYISKEIILTVEMQFSV